MPKPSDGDDMNTAHHPPIFETRFLNDGPQEFPRPSIWPRVFQFLAGFVVVCACIECVVWAVEMAVG